MRTVFKPLYLVLLIALFFGGCATMQSRWKDTETINTISTYEEFLRQYPQGTLANKARSRIENLNFDQAQAKNTIAAYDEFLRRYQQGRMADEARSRRKKIYMVKEWENAQAVNTVLAYKEFLEHYPTGKISQEAKLTLQKRAQNYISNMKECNVEFKWVEWTHRNRTEKELDRIKKVLLLPVKRLGIRIANSAVKAKLLIFYTETGWVLGDGSKSGIEYNLTFILSDSKIGKIIKKSYKGKTTTKGKIIEEKVTLEDGTTLVRRSIAVGNTFEILLDELSNKLKITSPVLVNDKTQVFPN